MTQWSDLPSLYIYFMVVSFFSFLSLFIFLMFSFRYQVSRSSTPIQVLLCVKARRTFRKLDMNDYTWVGSNQSVELAYFDILKATISWRYSFTNKGSGKRIKSTRFVIFGLVCKTAILSRINLYKSVVKCAVFLLVSCIYRSLIFQCGCFKWF